MVKPTLVGGEISDGELLLKEFDRQGIPVEAAYWLYTEEWDGYRLVLASSLVDQEGIKNAHLKVLPVVRSFKRPFSIRPDDVSLVSPKNKTVQHLRQAVGTGGQIAGIRFSRNTVFGEYIEDAYVYRA